MTKQEQQFPPQQRTINELGKLDILVNNAAEQHPRESIEEISAEQFHTATFRWYKGWEVGMHGQPPALCFSTKPARS
jgi:hypothetical protein